MSQAVFARVRLLLAALALLLCPAIASAQEQHRTFRVSFHIVKGLILLDAKVNGQPATLLLDIGANNSIVDFRTVALADTKLDKLRATGNVGAEGDCVVREVHLALEHRSWLNRRVCVMDLSDASKRLGAHIDGFTGADAFLNGSYTIASVSPTTIAVTVNHANYTAVGNGFVFQTGDSVTPCAPLASIFSDVNLTVPITQPGLTSDGIGNVGWYGAAGQYFVQYSGPGISTQVKPVTLSVPPGGTIASATNLVGPGSITGTFSGSPTLSGQLNSSVATGTAPFSIASTTVVPNLNVQLHNGLTAPGSAIVGVSDTQTLSGKTFDISANTLKNSTNSAGHYPRNNGTQYVDNTIQAADLPATASNCTGNQFAQGLNAGGTPICVTASGGVSEAAFPCLGAGFVPGAVVDPSAACGYVVFAQAHTLIRLTALATQVPAGCTTQAVIAFRDETSSTSLQSLTIANGASFDDSGAISVSMTAGHKFAVAVTIAEAGCTTTANLILGAVYQ